MAGDCSSVTEAGIPGCFLDGRAMQRKLTAGHEPNQLAPVTGDASGDFGGGAASTVDS